MTTTTHSPTVSSEYLSCAETAKLVRAALKRQFPTVKFSVRSSVYSGGASIDVKWIDGPTTRQVEAITNPYAGGRFDGMIDLAYSVEHWLTPDGTSVLANDPGTLGSRGSNPGHSNPIPPTPGARLVHLGADYIFCSRRLTNEAALLAEAERLAKEYNYTPVTEWRILSAIDFLVGPDTVEGAFRKVIENRDRE